MPPSSSPGRARPALVALGVQAVLVGIVFWPLPLRMGTMIAGGGFNWIIDVPLLQFVMAWQSRALVAHPTAVFDAPMYVPAPHAALYGPTPAGILPLFAPAFLATGNATLAMNVSFLASLVLTAWTTHLVVRRWTGSHAAGVAASGVLLSAEWISRGWVPSAPSYAALQWFPLLIARAASPMSSVMDWGLLVLLAWLQSLTDVAYMAPAVLVPLAVLGVVRTCRTATRRQGVAMLAAVGAAGLALLPLARAYQAVRDANPDLSQQTTWVVRLPTMFPHGLVLGPTRLEPAAWLLLVVGLLLAVRRRVAGRSRREDAGWRAIAPWWIVGIVLSIGPAFFWFDTPIENRPYQWLARLVPAVDALRTNERLRVVTLMATALGAGLAFAECVAFASEVFRRRRWPLRPVEPLALALVLVGLGTTVPHLLAYPVKPIGPTDPGFLAALRSHAGPVVDIPAPPSDTTVHAQAMRRAIDHRRPILNGYSGYWPAGFPERMALADALPDRDALRQLRAETGVETVVLRRDRLSPEATARWQRELADAGSPFRLVWQGGALMVVDVVGAPPRP